MSRQKVNNTSPAVTKEKKNIEGGRRDGKC